MTNAPDGTPPSRLDRRLGVFDAVVIGLGSMIGAGVFAVLAPAANAAGSGLLLGLAVAAFVAYGNATSSAALAAVYPASGGTYVYGRERLGPFWGHLAGWAFVVGKTASCAAMALTFASYAALGSSARWVAVTAVVVLTAVNTAGVRKTAVVTRVLVALVLAALAAVVAGTAFGGEASSSRFGAFDEGGVMGVLRSAGLLFFAFAGYARIATLGEEVEDPARTIPKAIPKALGLTLVVYAVVAVSALAAIGPTALAASPTPLATAVGAGRLAELAPVIRIGGAVASLGVLLSLLAGVSRTMFAMASDGALPRPLGAVHPRRRVPHRADIAVGALVVAAVGLADLAQAIGFSSFCVLAYYAIANASAWTLPSAERRWPRWLAGAGLVGCVVLAATLPGSSVLAGTAVLATGVMVFAATTNTRREAQRRIAR